MIESIDRPKHLNTHVHLCIANFLDKYKDIFSNILSVLYILNLEACTKKEIYKLIYIYLTPLRNNISC